MSLANLFHRNYQEESIKRPIKPIFFHGKLHLYLVEAKGLPNLDGISLKRNDLTDPYVTVDAVYSGKSVAQLAKTRVIADNLNPYWGEKFHVDICHLFDSIVFTVKDQDLTGTDKVGHMIIAAKELNSLKEINGWYPLFKKTKKRGSINICMRYISYDPIESCCYEVPHVISPLRTGCYVTLYQDAHTPAVPPLTDIQDKYGNSYEPPQLWVDISDALEKAEKIIYILGWSVETGISLLRNGNDEILGSVLKRKADQGVRVLIMIWDEPLNNEHLPGLMGVHDEETVAYFKGTKVKVCKASRTVKKHKIAIRRGSIGDRIKNAHESTIFTHHQKSIIVDAEIKGDSRRKLVAFLGGIDLCDGRWDTPEHCIYKTLNKEHKDDFYNTVKKSNATLGPRQPWHDVHQKVEGKITLDIILNFVDRWNKQAPKFKSLLLTLTSKEFNFNWKADNLNSRTDGGGSSSWNVQFFRSLNSDSTEFSTNYVDLVKFKGGVGYDDSIHQAYIHHIRRSKRFIYIENQYFLGSSFCWNKSPTQQSPNLIPLELTAKIINAICRKEDYRVYIVIPLHPEGDPTTGAVQKILVWQYRTMEMMYSKIGKAIKRANIDAHPTDYLTFYCLGKREERSSDLPDMPQNLYSSSRSLLSFNQKDDFPDRFMIYVHSKMAIFDDEYIIVGSANINERSMSGNRDTEMATGSYQPISKSSKANNEGDVRQFRLALWAEHCGVHMKEHYIPSDLECMLALNRLGQMNLDRYIASDTEQHTQSHLMIYPMHVRQNGKLDFLDGVQTFPDTGGAIFGSN